MLALCLCISVLTVWVVLVGLQVLSRDAASAIPVEVYVCAVIYSVLAAVIAMIAIAGYFVSRPAAKDDPTMTDSQTRLTPSVCHVSA